MMDRNGFFLVGLWALAGALLLGGCGGAAASRTDAGAEEAALAAYASFLSGDRGLLGEGEESRWWIPDFPNDGFPYEYTCLDLDGDGVPELLVQMEDDPCGYNGVFHFQDGSLVCWNSDPMEMSCRDYPLRDGTMVTQYDHGGGRSYTIFRYGADGTKEEQASLFARDSAIPGQDPLPSPSYQVDGREVDDKEFAQKLGELVTSKLLDRQAWTAL